MRGPSFPTAVDTGTPVSEIVLPPRAVREALAQQAVVLEEIAVAATAGDADQVLRLALRLAIARRRSVYTPSADLDPELAPAS